MAVTHPGGARRLGVRCRVDERLLSERLLGERLLEGPEGAGRDRPRPWARPGGADHGCLRRLLGDRSAVAETQPRDRGWRPGPPRDERGSNVGFVPLRAGPQLAAVRRGRSTRVGSTPRTDRGRENPGLGENPLGTDPDRPNYETKPFCRLRRWVPWSRVARAPVGPRPTPIRPIATSNLATVYFRPSRKRRGAMGPLRGESRGIGDRLYFTGHWEASWLQKETWCTSERREGWRKQRIPGRRAS